MDTRASLPFLRNAIQRMKINGNVEVGAVHGPLPFTLPSASLNNAYARGQISLGSKSFPVGIVFDLGTDHPIRGQRNSIRFQFDAPKLLKAERWEQARHLQQAQHGLDSMVTIQSQHRRQLAGVEAKISANDNMDTIKLVQSTHQPHVQQDSLAVPGDPTLSELDLPDVDGSVFSSIDSLRNTLPAMQEQQKHLDSLVAHQEQLIQRTRALVSLSGEKRGKLQELAQGIRRLELGSCAPSSSEFLLNGLSYQGVSFEYAHKDLFFAFDHGRSFDDTWMNNDPVFQDLRRLHQSLFLQDAQELSPKRITVLRTGLGIPEGSHAHIGFLRGVRGDVPPGYPMPSTPQLELTNHVIEMDLGHVFFKRHTFQVVYARSLTLGGVGTDDIVAGERISVGDLFNAKTKNNEALKAKWVSDLIKTGTRVSAELRSIDQLFHSFGIGFIRNGSRALEVSIDQRVNERLRLRGRAATEERMMPVNGSDGTFMVQRASVSAQWSVSEALRLRGGFSPNTITPIEPMTASTTTKNHVLTSGGGWRKRWKRTTMTADIDASAYRWTQAGITAEALNIMVSTGVEHGERLTIRYTRNALARIDADTIATMVNNTMLVVYRTRKGLALDASTQMANAGAFGWRLSFQQRLTERTSIRAEGARMPLFTNYLSTIEGFDQNDSYTWTIALKYFW